MKLPFKSEFPLTQAFGINPQYYTQFLVKHPDGSTHALLGHNGQDYGLPTGTEIVAPHHGKIIEAAYDEKGYGNYIKIENNEEGSVLAHLEKIDVVVGQEMNEGDHLATSDNTGYSTGAHLHWGYYRKPRDRANGYGGFVDQTPFISHEEVKEPVSGKLYTQEEYDAVMQDREKFWKERDEVIAASEELKKQLQEKTEKLTAFAAMGYPTIDDVTKKVDELNQTNLGLQTEIKQVKDRNIQLANMVAEKEKEDSTIIDESIKAQSKVEELQKELQVIAISMGTQPKSKFIVSIFDAQKRLADWGEKMLRSKEKADTEAREQVTEHKKTNPFSSLLSLFGLNIEGGDKT